MNEWQDIATAPRDGTSMLIASTDGIIIGEWLPSEGHFVDSMNHAPFWQVGLDWSDAWAPATHWMRLPALPPRQD